MLAYKSSTVSIGKNRGYPQIIHFNKVFHYKPSILGYPYFWKHPSKGILPSPISQHFSGTNTIFLEWGGNQKVPSSATHKNWTPHLHSERSRHPDQLCHWSRRFWVDFFWLFQSWLLRKARAIVLNNWNILKIIWWGIIKVSLQACEIEMDRNGVIWQEGWYFLFLG